MGEIIHREVLKPTNETIGMNNRNTRMQVLDNKKYLGGVNGRSTPIVICDSTDCVDRVSANPG